MGLHLSVSQRHNLATTIRGGMPCAESVESRAATGRAREQTPAADALPSEITARRRVCDPFEVFLARHKHEGRATARACGEEPRGPAPSVVQRTRYFCLCPART